jgi:hypothetical protein
MMPPTIASSASASKSDSCVPTRAHSSGRKRIYIGFMWGCLCVYHGTKPIEFEKGKAAIAVPSRDKLPALIDALIEAAKAGELDELVTRAGKPVEAPKSSRRAA